MSELEQTYRQMFVAARLENLVVFLFFVSMASALASTLEEQTGLSCAGYMESGEARAVVALNARSRLVPAKVALLYPTGRSAQDHRFTS